MTSAMALACLLVVARSAVATTAGVTGVPRSIYAADYLCL